jgi:hypothetical protein
VDKRWILVILFTMLAVSLTGASVAYAQTPTATPFPTVTPGPTPTPRPTVAATQSVAEIVSEMSSTNSFIDPIIPVIQSIINKGAEVTDFIEEIELAVNLKLGNYALKIHGYSPFQFFRGALILFEDFEWMGILAGWFATAIIVIVVVTTVRLLVALWGVVERLMSVIKTIPFFVIVGFMLAISLTGASVVYAQTATPTATTTPTATLTRTPTSTATSTPSPTPTPFAVLHDPSFIVPEGTDWTTSSRDVTWAYSRYTIPSGQAISQTVTYLTGTHEYSMTVRAMATTTSTMSLYANGALLQTFTVSQSHYMRTFVVTSSVTFPTAVMLRANTGPIVVDQIALARTESVFGPLSEGGEGLPYYDPYPLSIGGYQEYWQPIELSPVFLEDYFSVNWPAYMQPIGRIAATLLYIATPSIITYWFSGRVVIMCFLWLAGFVMQKIGRPIPPIDSNNVLVNIGSSIMRGEGVEGYVRRSSAFPKLPSSGIHKGRSRRSRW